MTGRWLPALVLLSSLPVALGGRQQPVPVTLVIDEPSIGLPLIGPSPLRAHVEPDSVGVRAIEFLINGISVCRVTSAPFQCTFDAGPRVLEREVIAVAVLMDGRRVTASRTTPTLGLKETVDIRAVSVPVLVLTPRGDGVPNLTIDDFEIFDNGVPQKLTIAEAENPQSQVAVAIDRSASMKDSIDEVKTVVRGFLDQFRPTDLITLAAFNHEFNILTLRESNAARRRQELAKIQPLGGTALYDAIYGSLGSFSDDLALKTVVVISDGADVHSKVNVDALAQRIRGTDAVVYVLMRRSAAGSGAAKRTLERFIQGSGGRWYEIDNARDLTAALNQIALTVKQQYLLGFIPTEEATEPRKLTVRVKNRGNVQIIARTEYGPKQ